MTSIQRLLAIATPALHAPVSSQQFKGLPKDLALLLQRRNGFYAFSEALYVFPIDSSKLHMGLIEWNSPSLWKEYFDLNLFDVYCFAEDIFGMQFCYADDGIYHFDPESGAVEFLAEDLESWADLILDDYEVLTGSPLAQKWQDHHGKLTPQQRLFPKKLFHLGGEYHTDNLYVQDRLTGMQSRAAIHRKIESVK